LARLGNKYLADTEPWKVIKTDESHKVDTIMNISIQICGVLSLICEPFLPNTSKKLKNQFNIKTIKWEDINRNNPVISNKIEKSNLIFRKIEDEEIAFQLEKLNDSKQ
jgi:methionyl-tRNA synthetase